MYYLPAYIFEFYPSPFTLIAFFVFVFEKYIYCLFLVFLLWSISSWLQALDDARAPDHSDFLDTDIPYDVPLPTQLCVTVRKSPPPTQLRNYSLIDGDNIDVALQIRSDGVSVTFLRGLVNK